jgi:hypothetical protein
MNSMVPPYQLPVYIHHLFWNCLGLKDHIVVCLWKALRYTVWEDSEGSVLEGLLKELVDNVDHYGGESVHSEEWLGVWIICLWVYQC